MESEQSFKKKKNNIFSKSQGKPYVLISDFTF